MNANTNIAPKVPSEDQKEIQSVVSLPDAYRDFEVRDIDDCQRLTDVLKETKSKVTALENRRKEITKPLDLAKQSVMDLFRPAVDSYKELESIAKPKITRFHVEQDKKRRQQEAEADERARKARERAAARAEKAREKGQEEKADRLEQEAATAVAQTPAHTQKPKGSYTKKRWTAKVTDPVALCRAVADGHLPPSIIEFKQAELNKVASTWQNNRDFPGLDIYQDYGVSIR